MKTVKTVKLKKIQERPSKAMTDKVVQTIKLKEVEPHVYEMPGQPNTYLDDTKYIVDLSIRNLVSVRKHAKPSYATPHAPNCVRRLRVDRTASAYDIKNEMRAATINMQIDFPDLFDNHPGIDVNTNDSLAAISDAIGTLLSNHPSSDIISSVEIRIILGFPTIDWNDIMISICLNQADANNNERYDYEVIFPRPESIFGNGCNYKPRYYFTPSELSGVKDVVRRTYSEVMAAWIYGVIVTRNATPGLWIKKSDNFLKWYMRFATTAYNLLREEPDKNKCYFFLTVCKDGYFNIQIRRPTDDENGYEEIFHMSANPKEMLVVK